MDISSLDTSKLRGLISLVEKRDKLSAELEKVAAAITAALGGKSTPVKSSKERRKRSKTKLKRSKKAAVKAGAVDPVGPPAVKSSRKTGRRGALKAKIVTALKAAGNKGVSVKDLSSKLGVKNQNIHVWFATTGKKLGAKKVKPGVYKL